MRDGRGAFAMIGALALLGLSAPGCAAIRMNAPSPDLRPGSDGFAATADGWMLGIRRVRPSVPDPTKRPVVLCHGLGLNGTFWTLTDDNLPRQLADLGYEVFIPDLRGSGLSHRHGHIGWVNEHLRQTPILELGEGSWTIEELVKYDVPAILEYVRSVTGSEQVDWVGHSLGGMLMFAYLEDEVEPRRVANFVGMASSMLLLDTPRVQMIRASRGIRQLLRLVSTGRMARPLAYARIPGLEKVDGFYYSAENVDPITASRFYSSALESPSRAALEQLEPYMAEGHLLSADGQVDYADRLNRVVTPTLQVAGAGDRMTDIASIRANFAAIGSADKTLLTMGKAEGQRDDYGHCDLVWSRHAPAEVFPPIIEWLDRHQDRPRSAEPAPAIEPDINADLRPRLESVAQPR